MWVLGGTCPVWRTYQALELESSFLGEMILIKNLKGTPFEVTCEDDPLAPRRVNSDVLAGRKCHFTIRVPHLNLRHDRPQVDD